MASQILLGTSRSVRPRLARKKHPRKTKSRQPLITERKALRRHRGPRSETDQLALSGLLPRSCIRVHSQEDVLKRTKIVLALPSNISTAFERHSSRLVPDQVSPSGNFRKGLKGCSVPTLALLTACR